MNGDIMHIVGNRPQFIKLAPVSREIRSRGYSELIIHTGQHFDENMSDIFFAELGIPQPIANLHVAGGTHSEMTARIMLELEPCIIRYNPKVVVVYGDTNSTLAAALVARKRNIPIVHVEAGARTRSWNNPEEVNRILVDHMGTILCAPDKEAEGNLISENLAKNSYFTGDVMYDTFLYCQNRVNVRQVMENYGLQEKEYILMTWHRQENTSDVMRMKQIIELIGQIDELVICPLHPRTRNKLAEYGMLEQISHLKNFKIIPPVGYLEMVGLTAGCKMVLTDSGGLSKESFFAGVRCAYMLDLHVWPDLERIGWIQHLGRDIQENIKLIKECMHVPGSIKDKAVEFYGNGQAAIKIVDLIEKLLRECNVGEQDET